ncbi:MAG: hypothetical protein A3F31_04885 [Candidatus Levybacteria bacterium RIFCSPHIGHO2_12_FULL_38_12]|nr:MAG: hypothetical protein A2770_04570 [Candidatus Levybacteria bacterium RIFCSPHIGHO2_01_FULL_38_12]OGH21755.1 MAG: hypothetical protein A3D75_01020 [Candidatus Levybacteria bacterium RIFCSPHIGHO2_02_FULL_37_18]OGH22587.1 MAG: hypothetical protein A3F31_04885 [Candidatus Levybacteria bacterium RIFCSPHIGHO2_12_FULL_38_12]OGH33376.1 MAG: hypothetical protein A3A47_03970 [Candidatus Levybacteria bacterium RIFCSPLOWO2_01_FULL_37_20]OGH44125.1 MAG: hypothetical protein A3J14_05255 [Candidatus Lev
MNQPLVSVNIRTFNSEKTLEKTLKSVKDQTYPNIEIVVSDGYSKDNSVEIAKKFDAKINFADKLGDARYQNYIHSKGKYIISLDSDQFLDQNIIEICVYECEKNEYNALIIAEKSMIKKGTFLEKLLAYDKWVVDKNQDADAVFGTACPRFFRKDLLKDVKWPRNLAVFDDTILYGQLLAKGAKIKYISNSFIRHSEVTTWIAFVKKFYRYGKGYFRALKEKPTTIAAHSLPRRSYFSKAAFSKPHYFFGLLLLYIIKVSAAGTGALTSLLSSLFEKNEIV